MTHLTLDHPTPTTPQWPARRLQPPLARCALAYNRPRLSASRASRKSPCRDAEKSSVPRATRPRAFHVIAAGRLVPLLARDDWCRRRLSLLCNAAPPWWRCCGRPELVATAISTRRGAKSHAIGIAAASTSASSACEWFIHDAHHCHRGQRALSCRASVLRTRSSQHDH